ncbi:hypothetical protein Ae201684P_011237 [Aphanomyces euteiches]|nr:hypothetical protein Ae201684P_011237 [Aphanomyces euteiches]
MASDKSSKILRPRERPPLYSSKAPISVPPSQRDVPSRTSPTAVHDAQSQSQQLGFKERVPALKARASHDQLFRQSLRSQERNNKLHKPPRSCGRVRQSGVLSVAPSKEEMNVGWEKQTKHQLHVQMSVLESMDKLQQAHARALRMRSRSEKEEVDAQAEYNRAMFNLLRLQLKHERATSLPIPLEA